MRRAVSSVTVALGLLGATVALSGAALAAAPAPGAAPEAAPGKKRCTVTDERLRELSGLVATKSGYIVINDSSQDEARKRVFFLDTKCKLAKDPVRYSGNGPFDTEDLALSPDGETLWIADIGDNITSAQRRERVAVWTMPVDGSERPVLHRLSYPEGKPHDAEALLIGDDNKPFIITKVVAGKAEIFTPSGKLKSGDTDPVPMTKVGEVSLPKTNTPNLLNTIGRVAITGAARSPDGGRVVLRTYADAFEYDVSGGDIVGALTKGKPRVTPLADPFGEAISYTPDGKTFVTVSDGGELAEDDPIEILAYTPLTTGAEALTSGDGAPPKQTAEKSWIEGLSLDEITYLVAALGVIGALMVGAGIVGIVRARKRPVDEPENGAERDGRGRGAHPDQPARGRPADGSPPGRDGQRAGVYGGAAAGAASGGMYGGGGPPAVAGPRRRRPPGGGRPSGGGRPPQGGGRAQGGGGVYGGGRPAGGGVYGGQPAARPPADGHPGRGAQPGRGGQPARGGRPGGAAGCTAVAGPSRRAGRPPGAAPGRPGDGGWEDGRGGYGPPPGRGHRGDRF
ncbi:hypothetical protein [Micromonospora olivasterospora]|uniref:WD40 repeat protein n=1 Tax=Micromonospora olivasterospora TaxID=1880 RepID=A0A562IDC9_MICOL|nr:hypothetical protein [Micromonospora olivasterospora]TWH68997.1 hypothetical protein JD77_03999 [Micromonospora olivasterospora]